MPSPFLTGFRIDVLRFVVVAEREVGWNAKELEVLDELLAETSDVGLTEPPVCDGLEEDEEEGNTPVGIPRLRAREEGKSTIG